MLVDIKYLYATLSPVRRRQLILLFLLMLLASIAEVVTLGSVVPFVTIFIGGDPPDNKLLTGLVSIAGMLVDDQRLAVCVLFVSAVLSAACIRILMLYCSSRISAGIGHELGSEVYRRSLMQPYLVHVTRNSVEVSGSLPKIDAITGLMMQMLGVSSSFFLAISLAATLLVLTGAAFLSILCFLGVAYLVVSTLTRRRLNNNSQIISEMLNTRLQMVVEGMASIRDILIDKAQYAYLARFQSKDLPLRRAQANNAFLDQAPKFVIEAVGVILLVCVAYYLNMSQENGDSVLAKMATLAVGAQRLLPLMQQIYLGWSRLSGSRQVLTDVAALRGQKIEEQDSNSIALNFANELRFESVSFSYPESASVLRDVSFSIPKGCCVGVVGRTGSGKSTLVDLMMGLLPATTGKIKIDGQELTAKSMSAWQNLIAHVPQNVYLTDASIAENIAVGVELQDIDFQLVDHAAKLAHIADYINDLPEGYMTIVGEDGGYLSGGQRQRIGLARAFYRDAPVIILDEATSALDVETEKAVMESINGAARDKTVVIIAHRLSTLERCDITLRVNNGCVESVE
ncbi:ABC transporter ATP-binding protein [Alcanivorax sp.]|uniref:ABC transporter ATP-binding protein n=1 Tax=Alcanivorax sp. TaxID=1872427 RepID=UPI0025C72A6C|nr:ABC transporter ATP-binding protein [Alcanivorax sp.]